MVVGQGDTGLSVAWLDGGEGGVVIPMQSRAAGGVNGSVAAAVRLFEAVRQRG